MALPTEMEAVVFKGPFNVMLERRPVPRIRDEQDIVVERCYCSVWIKNSELHVYRGHQPSDSGFIIGHEFTGVVVAKGTAVKSVEIGDKVVSPFTVSCNNCFYCKNGASARCKHCLLFGTPALDGSQARFVRVPLANGTVFRAPPNLSDEALLLMADIFPTGYFGVKSAIQLSADLDIAGATIVVIGCGPVGLCSLVAAAYLKPKHLFAVDSTVYRLQQAGNLDAEALNYQMDFSGMMQRVKDVTDGRGADIIIEAVGLSPVLKTAFDLVRPFGVICSVGVHNGEIPWSGREAYKYIAYHLCHFSYWPLASKNIRLQMGRCPVRSVFAEALSLLVEKQDQFSFMFQHVVPLTEFKQGYKLFESGEAQKVVFKP